MIDADPIAIIDPPRARQCAICDSERASYGFGPPGTQQSAEAAWYCAEHRAEGEQRWAARYVTRPRPGEPFQLR
jgi:hypothetical protein